MQTQITWHTREQWNRCASHVDNRGDVAVLQFLDAIDLLLVFELGLDAKRVEHDLRGHCGAAAIDVNIDALAVQVLEASDVLAREDMNLLVVQLRDVADALGKVRS